MHSIKANCIDILQRSIYPVKLDFDEHIKRIERIDEAVQGYLLPGFIDAHVHIESSMLVPSEFARWAVVHGTVATVSDPHEIANVLGMEGVTYMIEDGNKVNFKFNFGAPSCVPATTFESAGAVITSHDVRTLLEMKEIKYLAEMMNWPGVLYDDDEVMQKLDHAKALGLPIDGHAPGLTEDKAIRYANAGISTDHECFTIEEALDKLHAGMKIIIREGSAAKNFDALIPLLDEYADHIMFCSDDKHPDYLMVSHIDELVRRALAGGYDLFNILKAACINPIAHYGLDVGRVRVGDPADFIIVDDLKSFRVLETWIDGCQVAKSGQSLIKPQPSRVINQFEAAPIAPADIRVAIDGPELQAIVAIDHQLITRSEWHPVSILNEHQVSTTLDILKLVVLNRYNATQPAVAFIKNFGLKTGAVASTVAHDSHNIIAVAANDDDLTAAINALIACKGGISAVGNHQHHVLPLPVAGLMSTDDGAEVARQYTLIDQFTKEVLGSTLTSPFMTLSFMALLVIPALKLSDKGLFDGGDFKFTHCSARNKNAMPDQWNGVIF